MVCVLIFWVWLENGWLALLSYHAQILFWMHRDKEAPAYHSRIKKTKKFLLPALFTGLITYYTLPHIIEVSRLTDWLQRFKIVDTSLLFMIPYFGIIHPVLEERHWRPLTQQLPCGHLYFAAYHALVLYTLLPPTLVIAAVFILLTSSVLWAFMYKKEGALLSPILFHIFADLGIITAAFLLI